MSVILAISTMKQHSIVRTLSYARLVCAVVLCVCALSVGFASASSPISQGFTANESIAPGMIVGTKRSSAREVEYASSDSAARMQGVVTNDAAIEIIESGQRQVQVARDGIIQTYVSDINGAIAKNDRIAPSPLQGIGMRATHSGYVLGTAQTDFTEATSVVERQIADVEGKTRTVKIGLIAVALSVSQYESQQATDESSIMPEVIHTIVRTITGKDVSPMRIVAALFILVVGLGAIGILLNASIRSSITSIGRNPLAAPAVHRSVLEVLLFSVGMLLAVLTGTYIVLVI